jgi:large subunit ribosomal protein L33
MRSARRGCLSAPPHHFYTVGVKAMADIVGLQCTECKRRNYVTTVNKKKNQKKMEKKKFCKWCERHTLHKETK